MFDPSIKLIILFGSRAKGTAHKKSDTDIAILADHPLSYKERGEIAGKAAELCYVSEDDIDTVDLWTASPLLQQQVAQTGKLIFGNNFDFLRFRVLAWKRYQDTAKFRRARSERLKSFYNAG